MRLGVEASQLGWIAVRTSASSWPDPPTDISLDLFHFPGVRPIKRIQLFSPELTARMGEMGEHLLPYMDEPVEGPNWRFETVYLTVLEEANPPMWSPNGRFLAFTGAIDGPSSDLYVYDIQTDQVLRLTDGPNQAAILAWSPDSRWIIHSESSTYMIADGGEIGGFPADVVWAAAADGSEVRRLYGPAGVEWVLGWISDTQLLVHRWSGYIFRHDLREVDVRTGAVRTIYSKDAYNSVLAAGPQMVVVDAVTEWLDNDEYLPGGLQLVPMDGSEPKQLRPGVEALNAARLEWIDPLGQFLGGGFGYPFLFTPSGEITQTFETEIGWPAVSPDGAWLVFDEQRERPGLRLYQHDGKLVREISQETAYNFVWTPDSTGLYSLVRAEDSTRLIFVSIPEGEPVDLHPDPGLSSFILIEGHGG
jgi:dipeptidyl aminopeptidase/acylaminoacyl peptidase